MQNGRKRRRFVIAGFLLTLGLSGCKLGPDYSPPTTPYLQATYHDCQNPRLHGEPIDPRTWWTAFQDPVLSQLIEEAFRCNLDLKEAGQRILETRALRKIIAGNLYPQQQSLNAGMVNTRISENTANFFSIPGIFETDTAFDVWSTNVASAWELDFWGKYRRAIESADAQLQQTMASYDLVKVLMVGEVAKTYVELRTIEVRTTLAQQNLDLQKETLRLAELRLEEGNGTKLDVHQTRAIVAKTEAILPTLEILRRQASHRICVLLGKPPADIHQFIGCTGKIPTPPASLAVGIPADLLRRRPDVQVAERALASQSARIGIAKADFYPQISLVGQIGLEGQDLSQLFQSASLVGAIGPRASWNFLNYGRIKNKVVAEQEALQRLTYAYHGSVLKAYQEVEDAQVAFVESFHRLELMEQAVQSTSDATRIAIEAYKEGAIDFNRVLLLQADQVRYQDEFATIQGDIANGMVKLFVAMGGGWNTTPDTSCNLPTENLVHNTSDESRGLDHQASPATSPPNRIASVVPPLARGDSSRGSQHLGVTPFPSIPQDRATVTSLPTPHSARPLPTVAPTPPALESPKPLPLPAVCLNGPTDASQQGPPNKPSPDRGVTLFPTIFRPAANANVQPLPPAYPSEPRLGAVPDAFSTRR